jgi:hypothetical protein
LIKKAGTNTGVGKSFFSPASQEELKKFVEKTMAILPKEEKTAIQEDFYHFFCFRCLFKERPITVPVPWNDCKNSIQEEKSKLI